MADEHLDGKLDLPFSTKKIILLEAIPIYVYDSISRGFYQTDETG
jgi:hypothetical protein